MIDFLGLMHPAVVHMPIGFILITIIYEFLSHKDSPIMWFFSAISSLGAALSGLILLKTGYYEGLEVFLHLLSGWAIVILTSLTWLVKWKFVTLFSAQNYVLKALLIALLTFGGHKGAEITHGKSYFPFYSKESIYKDLSNVDSVVVYGDIITPIFLSKCMRCHEPDDARGKLDMSSQEGLLSNTFGRAAVTPYDLSESEIYRRLLLDPSDKKYMPPSGEDLNFSEKRLIEWWISEGASFDELLREEPNDPIVTSILFENYGITFKGESLYESEEIEEVTPEILNELALKNFVANNISETSKYLDITIKGKSNVITKERLTPLNDVPTQLAWLDLSDSNLDDDMVAGLSSFPNLIKLNINNTKITDRTIEKISELEKLQVLNIYNTEVTDRSIEHLEKLTNLKKIYVWQTKLTPEAIDQLKEKLPNLVVVGASN